jgi:hypothetical protein
MSKGKARVNQVHNMLKEIDKVELVNLERLTYILKGLSAGELETLEILLDKESSESIRQSIRELDDGKRIPIDECKLWGTSSNK